MTTATITAEPSVRVLSPCEFARHRERLDEDGYTLIPDLLDRGITARLRAHLDDLIAPEARHQTHLVRPPIRGAIMAELVTDGHVDLAQRLLLARNLRLLEQVLIRTPRSAEPDAPLGWHIDGTFYPRHRAATPRQTYYQIIHALDDIESGGGATMVVPGSHRLTAAAAARLAEPNERFPMRAQAEFKAEVMALAGVDATRGVEILARAGDVYIFDPMCVHAASPNRRDTPRAVFFQSFIDASATDLLGHLAETHYPREFDGEFRRLLPERLRYLVDP